jgi:hypothetical protein
MLDFYIGYEVDNPHHSFFYKPLKITPNLLTVELLEDYKFDPSKEYQFYFTLDGTNFSLIGKPVKIIDRNKAVFLIKDSSIELRRYPRIYLKDKDIKVRIGYLVGYLKDISLGGCRVAFDEPLPRSFYTSHVGKTLEFIIPGKDKIRVEGNIVHLMNDSKEAAFVFNSKNPFVVKLYKEVTDYLKEKSST